LQNKNARKNRALEKSVKALKRCGRILSCRVCAMGQLRHKYQATAQEIAAIIGTSAPPATSTISSTFSSCMVIFQFTEFYCRPWAVLCDVFGNAFAVSNGGRFPYRQT
jgi:hypothetical protein